MAKLIGRSLSSTPLNKLTSPSFFCKKTILLILLTVSTCATEYSPLIQAIIDKNSTHAIELVNDGANIKEYADEKSDNIDKEKTIQTYSVEPFTVWLSTQEGQHQYVTIKLNLKLLSDQAVEQLNTHRTIIRDKLLRTFTGLKKQQLESFNQADIKQKIIQTVNKVLMSNAVLDVEFEKIMEVGQ